MKFKPLWIAPFLLALVATPLSAKEILAFSCKLDSGKKISVHYDSKTDGYIYRASGKKPLTLRTNMPKAQWGGMARENSGYVFELGGKPQKFLIVNDRYDISDKSRMRDESSVRIFGGKKTLINKCVSRNDPGKIDQDALMHAPESLEFEMDYPQLSDYTQTLWD